MRTQQGSDLGYEIIANCLSPAECDPLIDALLGDTVLRTRAGARHLMPIPCVATLAQDSRLTTIAREWLGSTAVPFRATLFDKSSTSNWLIPWHQDTALPLARRFDFRGWGPWSEKAGVLYAHAPACALSRVIALRLHLDASSSDNGPLRVIPGSHDRGVLSDECVGHLVSTRPYTECLVPRGGILAMRPLLVHSSSKLLGREPRRVLHLEYADALELDGVRLAVA